jgi:hypothetical protein
MSRKTDGWRNEAFKLIQKITDREAQNDRDRRAANALLAAADAADGELAKDDDAGDGNQ